MEHQQTPISPEMTFPQQHHSDEEFKRRVRKTTILLSIITVIELGIGLTIYTIHKGPDPSHLLVLMFKGMVCILTLAKAYYIVSVLMHLGDEIRNMIMSIVVPLMLFIWFILAFICVFDPLIGWKAAIYMLFGGETRLTRDAGKGVIFACFYNLSRCG